MEKPRKIKSRYSGWCRECRKRFPEGEHVIWIKGDPMKGEQSRTYHERCFDSNKHADGTKEIKPLTVPGNVEANKHLEKEADKGPPVSTGRWCFGCGLPSPDCTC